MANFPPPFVPYRFLSRAIVVKTVWKILRKDRWYVFIQTFINCKIITQIHAFALIGQSTMVDYVTLAALVIY